MMNRAWKGYGWMGLIFVIIALALPWLTWVLKPALDAQHATPSLEFQGVARAIATFISFIVLFFFYYRRWYLWESNMITELQGNRRRIFPYAIVGLIMGAILWLADLFGVLSYGCLNKHITEPQLAQFVLAGAYSIGYGVIAVSVGLILSLKFGEHWENQLRDNDNDAIPNNFIPNNFDVLRTLIKEANNNFAQLVLTRNSEQLSKYGVKDQQKVALLNQEWYQEQFVMKIAVPIRPNERQEDIPSDKEPKMWVVEITTNQRGHIVAVHSSLEEGILPARGES